MPTPPRLGQARVCGRVCGRGWEWGGCRAPAYIMLQGTLMLPNPLTWSSKHPGEFSPFCRNLRPKRLGEFPKVTTPLHVCYLPGPMQSALRSLILFTLIRNDLYEKLRSLRVSYRGKWSRCADWSKQIP